METNNPFPKPDMRISQHPAFPLHFNTPTNASLLYSLSLQGRTVCKAQTFLLTVMPKGTGLIYLVTLSLDRLALQQIPLIIHSLSALLIQKDMVNGALVRFRFYSEIFFDQNAGCLLPQ